MCVGKCAAWGHGGVGCEVVESGCEEGGRSVCDGSGKHRGVVGEEGWVCACWICRDGGRGVSVMV